MVLYPRSGASQSKLSGFTLVEMMIVLTIAGILGAMAVSAYHTSIYKNHILAETDQLQTDLAYASMEAVRTGLSVTICASSDGTTCNGSTSWTSGWIVFDDPTATQQTVTGTVIRRYQSALVDGDTLEADNSIGAVTFNRGGYVSSIATTIPQVTFTDHAPTPSSGTTLCLAVSFLGQMSIESAGQGNCL
ncbi:MAG: prepilin-type N-terminal cleavage/methylation domain-containing protein [Pseudomonadales bacterium]|nr:prepilin-type N-terminal cleavage/methylation domain-containing protein [Pseudomonadales bacterium]